MRLRHWGLTFGALRRFALPATLLTPITSPFPCHSTWEAAEYEGSYVFYLVNLLVYALKSTHIQQRHTRYILPVLFPRRTLVIPPIRPHGLRRTAPGRLVVLRLQVLRTCMDA